MATTTIDSRKLEATASSNFVELYTNSTQFGYSKFDFTMICRRITFAGNSVQLKEVATIGMSPQHAKAVLRALQTSIEGYERDHGEIPVPKDKKVPLASATKSKAKK